MKSYVHVLCSTFCLLFMSAILCGKDKSAESSNLRAEFLKLQDEYEKIQATALRTHCLGCHSTAEKQGELDLEQFHSVADMRRNVIPWQRVVEMMNDGEMPPKDEPQPSGEEKFAMIDWITG